MTNNVRSRGVTNRGLLLLALAWAACAEAKSEPHVPSGVAGTTQETKPVTTAGAGSFAPQAGRAPTPPSGGQAGIVAASSAGEAGAGRPSAGVGGTSAGSQAVAGSAAAGSGGMASATAGSSGADAGGSPSLAAACTGKPGQTRGKHEQSVMAGGQRRTFVHYAPKTLDANRPVPLVIIPHGYTQSGEAMFNITQYSALADREGFVAVFPDGAPNSAGPWDVGKDVCGNGSFVPGSGDDQAFVDQMIAFASADQCLDKEHIFMTGWSMGGYFSHHSGCLRDDIRAIGPHSGGTHDLSNCKTKHKPVIMFHFDPDGLIDYSCGTRARDSWIKRNGCSAEGPDMKTVKGGSCAYYKGCPADGQVAFCTFAIPANHKSDFLAGHAWSGGTPQSYSIAETESAAELGWSFFKTYAW